MVSFLALEKWKRIRSSRSSWTTDQILKPAWDTQDCLKLPTQEGGRGGTVVSSLIIIKILSDKKKTRVGISF